MKNQTKQSGSISMITVLFLTMILTLITVSALRLMVRERDDATDVQLTSQAFYAAESGVEDAKKALEEYVAGNITVGSLGADTCQPYRDGSLVIDRNLSTNEVDLSDDGTVAYTCQIIELEPNDYVKELQENQATMIKLAPDGGSPGDITSVTIEWHREGTTGTADGNSTVRDAADTSLPSPLHQDDPSDPLEYCWHPSCDNTQAAFPALLKVGLFSHPTSSFSRGDITNSQGFFNPADQSGDTINETAISGNGTHNDVSNAAECSTSLADSSGYKCRLTIDGMNLNAGDGNDDNDKVYYLQLTPFYRKTWVRVTMNGGSEVYENSQAVIDVTGRAANIFRRIKTRVNLAPDSILPAYDALTTTDGICKKLTFDGTAPEPDDACPRP